MTRSCLSCVMTISVSAGEVSSLSFYHPTHAFLKLPSPLCSQLLDKDVGLFDAVGQAGSDNLCL